MLMYNAQSKHVLRGGKSLLCSGIELYNRYLFGWAVASLPVAMAGLVGRLWAMVYVSFELAFGEQNLSRQPSN